MTSTLAILVAEDNEDDAIILQMACRKNFLKNPVHICSDGTDAINYLKGSGKYADRQSYPFPSVIYLDLKMPIFDGFDLLSWLKKNRQYALIPTVVLTSSRQTADVKKAYELGANCYIVKPGDFDEFVRLIGQVHEFWAVCEKPDIVEIC